MPQDAQERGPVVCHDIFVGQLQRVHVIVSKPLAPGSLVVLQQVEKVLHALEVVLTRRWLRAWPFRGDQPPFIGPDGPQPRDGLPGHVEPIEVHHLHRAEISLQQLSVTHRAGRVQQAQLPEQVLKLEPVHLYRENAVRGGSRQVYPAQERRIRGRLRQAPLLPVILLQVEPEVLFRIPGHGQLA